ncbi:TPA: hypothetical protein ACW0I5_001637, partial [Escherichia coli]
LPEILKTCYSELILPNGTAFTGPKISSPVGRISEAHPTTPPHRAHKKKPPITEESPVMGG